VVTIGFGLEAAGARGPCTAIGGNPVAKAWGFAFKAPAC
jgi:hypothetical protein